MDLQFVCMDIQTQIGICHSNDPIEKFYGHPNNSFSIVVYFQYKTDLVLNLIQYQDPQYLHPNKVYVYSPKTNKQTTTIVLSKILVRLNDSS